jgi:hypothetical protein
VSDYLHFRAVVLAELERRRLVHWGGVDPSAWLIGQLDAMAERLKANDACEPVESGELADILAWLDRRAAGGR